MSSSTDILDSLLPLLQPEGRELHLNAAIVEVAEPAQLAELAANPRIRRFLLARLSDTVGGTGMVYRVGCFCPARGKARAGRMSASKRR